MLNSNAEQINIYKIYKIQEKLNRSYSLTGSQLIRYRLNKQFRLEIAFESYDTVRLTKVNPRWRTSNREIARTRG